ncbi:MAG: monovalent cation/H+ antiporter complex subunit F [Chlamydiota bacterium]|nr:monovalent cation/H+ antiporter complex subunit F [Chlamydiota bacterium]
MIDNACFIANSILYLSFLLGLVRLFIGPRTLDRVLAFDYLCGVIIALITVHSIQIGSFSYIEMILIFSLLGFATVISFMEVFFARLKR